MNTQTPPRKKQALSQSETPSTGLLSRRDAIKGALVGAGALAFMALPNPLAGLVPAMASTEAEQSNQIVADGIYAFRYTADNNFSLDLPYGNPNPVNIQLGSSNNSPAQYWVVQYEDSTDAYKIIPLCGYTPGMVLTATASKNEVVKTRKENGETRQRWVFKQNPNGSYSICNKGNTSLCVNLTYDNRTNGAGIQLFTYSSTDIASQWRLSCTVPAVKTNLHYMGNFNTVYSSDFAIYNSRENHPKIVSKPSGWTVTNDSSGYPDTLQYNGKITSPSTIKIKYENIGDLRGEPIDILVELCVIAADRGSGYYNNNPNTYVDLSWNDKDSGVRNTKGFFAGICVLNASRYSVKYTVFNHSTGEQISLKGAYLTTASLNGSVFGDPCNYYDASEKKDVSWEGVAYLQSAGTVDAYIVKDHGLCLFSEGDYFGRGNNFEDYIGGEDMPRKSVMFKCADDSPTVQYFSFSFSASGACGVWSYPLLMPMGILDPGDPEKSASIQG